MEKSFGELVIYCGKKHTFIGIDIPINNDKTIKVEMKDQLNKVIYAFIIYGGETITELVTSPAQTYLRIGNKECKKLIRKKRELFHTVVAKLLYTTK